MRRDRLDAVGFAGFEAVGSPTAPPRPDVAKVELSGGPAGLAHEKVEVGWSLLGIGLVVENGGQVMHGADGGDERWQELADRWTFRRRRMMPARA